MDRSDHPNPGPSPASGEQIGTDAEQSEHRPPAPSPAEHNAMYSDRYGYQQPAGFDSAGQHP